MATERVLNKSYLIALLYVLEEGVGNTFYFNEHSRKLVSSATESQKQILHAYMGHPV